MANFYLHRPAGSSVHRLLAWDRDTTFQEIDAAMFARVEENVYPKGAGFADLDPLSRRARACSRVAHRSMDGTEILPCTRYSRCGSRGQAKTIQRRIRICDRPFVSFAQRRRRIYGEVARCDEGPWCSSPPSRTACSAAKLRAIGPGAVMPGVGVPETSASRLERRRHDRSIGGQRTGHVFVPRSRLSHGTTEPVSGCTTRLGSQKFGRAQPGITNTNRRSVPYSTFRSLAGPHASVLQVPKRALAFYSLNSNAKRAIACHSSIGWQAISNAAGHVHRGVFSSSLSAQGARAHAFARWFGIYGSVTCRGRRDRHWGARTFLREVRAPRSRRPHGSSLWHPAIRRRHRRRSSQTTGQTRREQRSGVLSVRSFAAHARAGLLQMGIRRS